MANKFSLTLIKTDNSGDEIEENVHGVFASRLEALAYFQKFDNTIDESTGHQYNDFVIESDQNL